MTLKIRLTLGILLLMLLASACTGLAATPTATVQLEAEETENMGEMETSEATKEIEDMGEMETSEATKEMEDMSGMGTSEVTQNYAPLVMGLYEGGDVLFIHTEASDPDVANMLTEMMAGPLVVLVPELAQAPEELLANVYVFTNGVEGHGPFGFQPDIFDSVPGDEDYRPLRAVNLVEWNESSEARELRSVSDLQEAEEAGELTISQPGIVVNMPILVWPGGSR